MAIIDLQESTRPSEYRIPREVASALAQLNIATVTPTLDPDSWVVGSVRRIGALRVAGHDVRISPKVPIARLFFMLGYSSRRHFWRDETIELDEDEDLLAAVAHAFLRQLGTAVSKGLLQGYRTMHVSERVVRGRIDFNEQIKRRTGLPLPLEVTYDEYTVDIVENRVLASAIDRMLRISQIGEPQRHLLRQRARSFAEAGIIPRGAGVPAVAYDRRNQHYRSAIELARLILSEASIEHRVGRMRASGFLINGADIFEDFVTAVMKEALENYGGTVSAQHRGTLDDAEQLRIRPDIVWTVNGRIAAILDAKYKAEKPAGYPNADIYQMLAYCTRYGLAEGHLIYAAGEAEPARHDLVGAGVRIFCHAVNLDGTPEQIIENLNSLASQVAQGLTTRLL